MPFPYIFTFYSYKGGVGRSMAVMNVAYTLAGRGRHVLLLDMDLEAPGLTGFLVRNQEFAPVADHRLDVLDLLGEAIRAAPGSGAVKEKVAKLPPVSNYIRPVSEEKLAALRPKMGQMGRLDVLGTDQSPKYFDRLAELDLRKLGHEGLVALSNLLHFYFKAQVFPHRPLGIESFEPPIQTPYDYVLVDSRTGMTEIGGLCVGPLSDRLVVMTSLNDQNVQGTLTFLQEAGIKTVPRLERDEKWDDADEVRAPGTDNANLGPKPTIVVASPVPYGEVTYKGRRLDELKKLLGIRPVSLSYHPHMALMETIFVRDYPEEYLASEYRRVTTHVMAQVGDDPQSLARRLQAAADEEKDLAKAIRLALPVAPVEPGLGIALLEMLGNRVLSGGPDPEVRQLHAFLADNEERRPTALSIWGNALSNQAKTKTGEEADQLFEEAGRKCAEALRLEPLDSGALNNWAVALSDQAKTKTGEEADRLFEEAGGRYAEALRLKPEDSDALNNWGVALSDQAGTKTGEEADRLFEEAGRKYANALRLRPEDPEVLYNWGSTLSHQAITKTGEKADRVFEEAGRKYAAALRLHPEHPESLTNWGNALCAQAKTKAGEDADRLFEEAGRKYAEALRQQPEAPDALNNWGVALSEQAKTKTGEDADRLFEEAGRKYAEALRLRPEHPDVLYNWGNALSDQAKSKTGDEADRLFEEADRKYAEALRLKSEYPGAVYNWGTTLSEQAKTKTGEDADRLFEEAGRKYAEALRLKPEDPVALYNWGVALVFQSKNGSEEAATRLLRRAREKLLEAERLRPGIGAYNLACVASLEGDAAEAARWLRALESIGQRQSVARIAAEKAFDRVRNHPEFASFLQSLAS